MLCGDLRFIVELRKKKWRHKDKFTNKNHNTMDLNKCIYNNNSNNINNDSND